MLLVLCDPTDAHLPLLLPRLEARGADHVCLDTADFPAHVALELGLDAQGVVRGVVRGRDRSFRVSEVTAVWTRHPAPPRAAACITDPTHRAFAEQQGRALLDGLWWLLDCRWMPARPMFDQRASNRLVGLTHAARLGFAIPDTVMTNDPEALLELHEYCDGRLVSKAFARSYAPPDDGRFAYQLAGFPVRRRDLANLRAVRYAPAVFQRQLARRAGLRVIVVGDRTFAFELSGPEDPRRDEPPQVQRCTLPDELAARCVRLVGALELAYAAIDLAVTADGEHVFLELDASGAWAELERQTGAPIADAVLDELLAPAAAAREVA